MIMVYTTMPSQEASQKVVRALLEKKLIACATIVPCKSMYWWNESIQEDQECIVLAKTTADAFELLQKELTRLHPYQVPCIIKIAATANDAYAHWLNEQLL